MVKRPIHPHTALASKAVRCTLSYRPLQQHKSTTFGKPFSRLATGKCRLAAHDSAVHAETNKMDMAMMGLPRIASR
jgi:hypothetical protein